MIIKVKFHSKKKWVNKMDYKRLDKRLAELEGSGLPFAPIGNLGAIGEKIAEFENGSIETIIHPIQLGSYLEGHNVPVPKLFPIIYNSANENAKQEIKKSVETYFQAVGIPSEKTEEALEIFACDNNNEFNTQEIYHSLDLLKSTEIHLIKDSRSGQLYACQMPSRATAELLTDKLL